MLPLQQFALAGKAIFTVVSKKTGTRFTFKVRKPNESSPHFVSLLNGPCNESSYTFLGTIFNGESYHHGRKSRVTPEAPSAQAFNWIWKHRNDPVLLEKVEVHHEGKCCRCGRTLTTPESVTNGYGPECAKHMA
jgi:hypothetical protein